MVRRIRLVGWSPFSSLSLMLVLGCTFSAELRNPISAEPLRPVEPPPRTQPTTVSMPESPATPGTTGVPEGFALFGDRPEFERVPFESRLVSNLNQHSFTSEGLDFDPDIYDPEQLLVFASTRNSQAPDIFLKTVEGYTLTQITGDPADDIQPRFSPDGTKIAFCSNRAGTWDIWLVHRDGTNLQQLTGDGTDDIAPCWSPDGRQIVYSAFGNRSRRWELWTLNVEQPGTRRFLAYGMFPAWSPDGEHIAFQRARERGGRLFSIWTIQLVEGEARHPTEIAHSDTSACIAPRWSPDGQMIVYCTVREGERHETVDRSSPPAAELWVVELESGMRMKLTDGAGADFNPVWAADGRIYFVSARAGTENIWSLTTHVTGYAVGNLDGTRVSRVEQDLSSSTARD